jgi:hypothetical protein
MKKVAIFSNSSNAKAPTPPPPNYYDRSRQKNHGQTSSGVVQRFLHQDIALAF